MEHRGFTRPVHLIIIIKIPRRISVMVIKILVMIIMMIRANEKTVIINTPAFDHYGGDQDDWEIDVKNLIMIKKIKKIKMFMITNPVHLIIVNIT